jgi:hypothetical protein
MKQVVHPFSALQNHGSSDNLIIIYLRLRRDGARGCRCDAGTAVSPTGIAGAKGPPNLVEPIKYSAELDSDLSYLIRSVKKLGLEGPVAKRRDSRYQPGLRTSAWWKMRVNAGQKFVIGGYTLGNPFDALVFGLSILKTSSAL